jgi:hypothetical protein
MYMSQTKAFCVYRNHVLGAVFFCWSSFLLHTTSFLYALLVCVPTGPAVSTNTHTYTPDAPHNTQHTHPPQHSQAENEALRDLLLEQAPDKAAAMARLNQVMSLDCVGLCL